MTVRNTCVARGGIGAIVDTIVFTVPAQHTLLVKNALLQNAAAVANDVILYARSSDGSFAVTIDLAKLAAGGFANTNYWVALNAGDTLHVSPQGGSAYYWISGALLVDS